ncbi:acyl-CoA dehydratase activase [Candidatus Magnetomonas plexicatena]|uniref:acyl-CoA dehydratase activase n=1 Tax=Candidatus Magnetomonas plexicatena TaxID=2552947 RepID=UPI001C774B67|nr:CoA protein activase [Nitrospirales bacterium LBB_01]
MDHIGLDVGSVSVKAVVLDENGNLKAHVYERHRGHPLPLTHKILKAYEGMSLTMSITGSAGKMIAEALGINHINELTAQSYTALRLHPEVKTIIEMGGEDSKLILLGENSIKDFSMNSVCAAGTGSFLDQQAERMRLSIEQFSDLAVKCENPPRIAGRCSVFAKSDMIHLQQIATPVEDIVSGLCFAVARNFKGSIVKGRQIFPEIAFTGGVALNKGMVRAFKEVFELQNLIVPEHCALTGAIGAALKDIDSGTIQNYDLSKLEHYIKTVKYSDKGKKPLIAAGDNFKERHFTGVNGDSASVNLFNEPHGASCFSEENKRIKAYMGVDIGSISTNVAVIDASGNLLARQYLMTASRPIEAVMQGLKEVGKSVGGFVEIVGVGTTGSGRYMIADFIGADIVKNEITAQATAAISIDNRVDTIFEIGGQDSKYIAIEDGVIVDFEMNKACAAGTGSFLEEQAEKLSVSIKEEFASECFCSSKPCSLGERCTVFMENSLMANIHKGAERKDLLAGLSYSIVENYINRVVAGKKIGSNIFFQGGTAYNKAVVAAFEKFTGQQITVPPNHDVTGAIGMAMIARDKMSKTSEATAFKGFSIVDSTYSVKSFECKSCSNLCEINKVTIDGEKGNLFYGGRCEKYDIKRKQHNTIEDLFIFRENLLWDGLENSYKDAEAKAPLKNAIGIPYIFLMHDYLPFWKVILTELGFNIIVSPKTNRQVVNLGAEVVLSESCFPVKTAHGHIKWLLDKGIKNIFLPSYVNTGGSTDEFSKGSPCPYTQTMPYMALATFNNLNVISPIINFSRSDSFLEKEISKAFGVSVAKVKKILPKAKAEQAEFFASIRKKGKEALSQINENSIVIVGRPYNSFDSGVNLQIPQKLATLDVKSIPMDMLPLSETEIKADWPDMYWRSGQRILKAARFIKNHPHLYPVFIGNFNCGPDSFILKYFKEELGDKPFLHLEIDEHSADAGAITRCEAFLDSIANRKDKPKAVETVPQAVKQRKFEKIYIPRMSDHAYALAAAFEYSGIASEVLPESDEESIELGRRYVSGKECYPCVVTTGDMLRSVFSEGFDADKSAFFMPSGTGPCRFGQYTVFQRLLLDQVGLKDVQIFSPVQDTSFYSDLGIAGQDFVMRSWHGIVAIELLTKSLHETRPYETVKGQTAELYNRYLMETYDALKGKNLKLDSILKRARLDFQAIPRKKEKRPLIGVIGEIFVRSNKFSNENLVEKIEALGGEAWLAPVEEWIYYVNYFGFKHALVQKDYKALMDIAIKRVYKKAIEYKYARHFRGFLKTLHEPDTGAIVKKAAPYVHESFEGETILSMGKAVDLIQHGVAGIVNTMPFGCMPGTIVTALMRAINRDYGIASISIPYDGTESTTTELQLETFMEQAMGRNGNGNNKLVSQTVRR